MSRLEEDELTTSSAGKARASRATSSTNTAIIDQQTGSSLPSMYTPGQREHLLSHIPDHLRIQILYADEDIIVIDKPSNLRSVPGNADSTSCTRPNEGQPHHPSDSALSNTLHKLKMSAADAWIKALGHWGEMTGPGVHDKEDRTISSCDEVDHYIARLTKLHSIPRRFKVFRRFLEKNKLKIFHDDEVHVESLSKVMFERIQNRQQDYLQKPAPTTNEESAYGQLILMNYGTGRSSQQDLFIVHRLDMDTSGIMVFARNEPASASLGAAWRSRDRVHKVYRARVYEWPPTASEGRIVVQMERSGEGIRWHVVESPLGKRSETVWKKLDDKDSSRGPNSQLDNALLLELSPITGRTHQLRVHCAHVGSGIVGDRLYGRGQQEGEDTPRLLLHAYRLSFPHPRDGKIRDFVCPCPF